jgi:adenylosuccinate synthase
LIFDNFLKIVFYFIGINRIIWKNHTAQLITISQSIGKKNMDKNTIKKGYSDVLIGLQYGDEGKARVVDLLAKNYDIIARFNGGANAGHTVSYNGIEIALNQVPSGIFNKQTKLYIGSGCVVNIVKLAAEIQKIEDVGINLNNRLFISGECSIIQPHHVLIDIKTGETIGTTKNGIGPAYADKANRMINDRILNIRLGALQNEQKTYFKLIQDNYDAEIAKYKPEEITHFLDGICNIVGLQEAFKKIEKYIQVDTLWMQKQAQNGAKILFEGAQSVMLDVNKGAIPFVTSSSTIASAAYSGGDLSVNFHRKVIGVGKAIMSRVGNGPFTSEFGGMQSEKYCQATNVDKMPTYNRDTEKVYKIDELLQSQNDFELGKALRVLSYEYGVVSRRPRRIGRLDLVQLKYSCMMNGVDELVITKFDMLNIFAKTHRNVIEVTVKYSLNKREIDFIPSSSASYYRTVGENQNFETFNDDISNIRNFEDLPDQAKILANRIQDFTGCKLIGLGVGPERDQYISIK